MAKGKQQSAVPVKDAIFFPDDFRKLKGNYLIYIRDGFIKNLDGK